MRVLAVIITLFAAGAGASGCTTAAIGTVASVGVYAAQDRTIGEGIDDAAASQQVKVRLLAADRVAFQEVDVEVANRNLLLSGTAPTAEHRQAAETIARSVRTIDNVYNEIVIGQPSTLVRNAQDELITAQIRARLTASRAVRAINVNIETFHGNVYLMGTARSEEELRRAAEIASVVGGVRRVVSFMQVRAPDAPYYAQAEARPPAPEYRGDGDDDAVESASADPY
ncbi:MAG TPA: BON domain-containing protein [Vitreimonas sp.]|uniref:BON domain-containing protein n=1 Tax=Vitreimonas sp. TaxID=3069702 RepID=UPI002D2DCC63|nr:BON domain-containing protein [Vitreimonas sp.]HYD89623.1 BON domain-containing protein [Vitreimonas sp.]